MRAAAVWLTVVTIFTALISISGCTTSVVRDKHPAFSQNVESGVVLYFLRPRDQRTRGIVDRDINVVINDESIMALSTGEYAAVRIVPGKTEVMLRNLTYIATRPQPEEVWRSFRMTFEPGKTYFILAKMEMEEFRGVYFMPQLVERDEISKHKNFLKPAGNMAKRSPLF